MQESWSEHTARIIAVWPALEIVNLLGRKERRKWSAVAVVRSSLRTMLLMF